MGWNKPKNGHNVSVKLPVLLRELSRCPLVASVQGSPKSPVDHPDTLLRLARASVAEGVRVLRLEGVKSIRTINPAVGKVPVIGLLKRSYPKSEVYITPAAQDVDSLVELGVAVIAIDATQRPRPFNQTVAELIERIHRRGVLALADCDTVESAIAAERAGADLISTTLGGYTAARAATQGPDFELLREVCQAVKVPVLAEGRFTQRWQVDTALQIGAVAVVVGGALNDPVKQTRALRPDPRLEGDESTAVVGAVDIGGTWLRFGTFNSAGKLLAVERTQNPPKRQERLRWIREQVQASHVARVGVGTGGIVDPHSGEVWTAKEYLMPDHIGLVFDEKSIGVPTFAFGDGHATAWAHACLPAYAGLRVATLALGTGVGCGFVQEGKIWAGRRGDYPRINDLPAPGGKTYEELLGGIHISKEPSEEAKAAAVHALEGALKAIRDLYFPDVTLIAGSVGLSDWLRPHLDRLGAIPSPLGTDAGLYGAAALALYPSWKA